jgi:hypothetical protein
MATDRLVSAPAYGGRYDKPISGVLHHHRGHDPALARRISDDENYAGGFKFRSEHPRFDLMG